MWWQYVFPFVGSLFVALISVWIAQSWSAKRDYRKLLENLRGEVNTNINVSNLIIHWVDTIVGALENGNLVVASCPRLYDGAWLSVKGALAIRNYALLVKLEESYLLVSVANDLLRTVEELKWGAASAMTNVNLRRKTTFDAIRETVGNKLLPKLTEARKLLNKSLGLTDSGTN